MEGIREGMGTRFRRIAPDRFRLFSRDAPREGKRERMLLR